MMKRPNEGDSNARASKVIRSKDRLSATPTELDGKIIASRFEAIRTEHPVAETTTGCQQQKKECENSATATAGDTFPEKLAETLQSEDVKDAIWWNAEGTVFAMMPKNFTDKVLNKLYQGTKMESFQRKMKRWGFERCFDTTFPRGSLVYYHPLFQRDRPELMSKMSAGMNKYAARQNPRKQGSEALATTTTTASSSTAIGSTAAPPCLMNPTNLASFYYGARLGGIPQQQQQQQIMQSITAERLRAAATMNASQTALRGLCLQTLRNGDNPAVMPPLPYHLQPYLASNNNNNGASLLTPPPPTFGRPTNIDLSSMSMLRLLQLRDMLSRTRSGSS